MLTSLKNREIIKNKKINATTHLTSGSIFIIYTLLFDYSLYNGYYQLCTKVPISSPCMTFFRLPTMSMLNT